jgi:hypothetical protein
VTDQRRKDLRVAAFFVVAVILVVVAVFVGQPGRRSIGGLVLGPMMIGYALYGLSKGNFTELSKSNRGASPAQFWFVFGVFASCGVAMLVIGIEALVRD